MPSQDQNAASVDPPSDQSFEKVFLAASSNAPHETTAGGTELRPYSVFTKSQKRTIIILVTFAAAFSPLSSFVFFPTINALSNHLHVSVEKINLTVTSYMIVAGIAPAIMGDLADMSGRRVVYLLTLGIYISANVGLALQNSWAALFALRMLQSAGGAATIAIAYGTVSDIAAPAERGGYVSIAILGPNFATAIGPIIGGGLTQRPGWRWTFWFLALAAGLCLVLIAVILPETSRYIVGNGSREVSGIHRSVLAWMRSRESLDEPSKNPNPAHESIRRVDEPMRIPFRIPNPLASLRFIWAKDAMTVMVIYGIFYMNFSCLQASLSTLVLRLYNYSEVIAGLMYLPFGSGSILGAYSTGFVMDRDYKATARRYNITIDKEHGDDLKLFPIEKARLRSLWYFIAATGGCTIGYGWSLEARTHIAIPLVLQFFIGFATAFGFNMTGTLLTDLHPKAPATAQAANNIVRCSLAGAGLAVLQVLFNHIGVGWTFTLIGGLIMSCLGFTWLEWTYGKSWSLERSHR